MKPLQVLLIEDSLDDARLILESLAGEGDGSFQMEVAHRLSEGLERLARGGIDVLLLDLGLPDSQARDTFFRAHLQAGDVPIVVLSGLDEEALALDAVQAGAQDYLMKSWINTPLLARALRYAVERKRLEGMLREPHDLETVGRLAGGAGGTAHQYNNLLTVIKGYCELLLEELGPGEVRLRGAAEEIRKAADRAASLTRLREAAEPAGVVKEQVAPARRTETILLVEDNESVRRLLRDTLERSGYQVLEARDGAEALVIARRQEGRIHLMLTDLVMPAMGGGELAEHLALSHPGMPVLYMSSYTDNPIARHGPEPGAAFLPKPFGPAELARKVRELLDSRSGVRT